MQYLLFLDGNSSHVKVAQCHKVRHPRCVYNKLDWIVYTYPTQLYDGIDMYNLLHKEQLHVSALFIGHFQVEKLKKLSKQLYSTCVGCIQWGGQR